MRGGSAFHETEYIEGTPAESEFHIEYFETWGGKIFKVYFKV